MPSPESNEISSLAWCATSTSGASCSTPPTSSLSSIHERCTLAQRGHSKEGRKALRIVGLALLVTADFHLPLLHHTYAGNQSPTFASLTDALVARYREQGAEHWSSTRATTRRTTRSTTVRTTSSARWFRPNTPSCTPADRLRSLDGLDGVSAWRTTRTLFGVERTVLVTRETLRRAVPNPAARKATAAVAGTSEPAAALARRARPQRQAADR